MNETLNPGQVAEAGNMTMLESPVPAFRPTVEFVQTCGACGSVFRVELESRTTKDDRQTYSCPQCAHHPCHVGSPKPPRVTLVRKGEGRKSTEG